MDSIVQALSVFAKERPQKTAVIADETEISYAELWQRVEGFAKYLRSLGLPQGARVIVKSAPSIWFAVSCLGIHLAGCVHAPLEKTIGENGLYDVAARLDASVIISDLEAREGYVCITPDDVLTLSEAHAADEIELTFPTRDMLCDILFTTGTTGKSKGVMVSHRAVVAVAENVQYGASIPDGNVYLVPVPINHAGAIRKLYVSILMGNTVVLLDGFTKVKKFYQYIHDYKVTSILMPPSAVRMMLVLSSAELAKYADQLDHIHTGSSSFPESDKEKLSQLLPNTRLYYGYGSSEAGCAALFDYAAAPGKICCVGKPNKNARILIVDDDHKEIRATKDNPGLIAVAGDVVMEGYYGDPELTASSLSDGVLYTNDLGYYDDEGFYYMLGRRDDVINVGGLKVAPTEVEEAALRFDGIAECVCCAVPDRMGGSILKLLVVMKNGCELDTGALRSFLDRTLETFKIPKLFETVSDIPKTANGKIDRKKLRVPDGAKK